MNKDSISVPLRRELGLRDATAIVVGVVIGTGVFLKAAVMTQQTGSAGAVLAAWAVAGLLSLLGAFTYAELSSLLPSTGGEYVFLREGYGRLPAFLYGWTRFWIISPGSIAAYAAGAATFSDHLYPLGFMRPVFASGLIVLFSVVNCFSVGVSGRVQTVLTVIKVSSILFLTAAIFTFSDRLNGALAGGLTAGGGWDWTAFGAAVLAALWAFDGWSNLPLAAGEVKEPQRVLPLALAGGTLLVFLIYALVNLAYFYALPLNEIATSFSTSYPNGLAVAAKAAQTALGPTALVMLSALFVVSALGAMNGSVLTGARVPYAMAHDGLFFPALARVNGETHVPVIAVAVQAAISIVSVWLGSFDQLTDYVVFSSWIFYGLVATSLFIFRRRHPARPGHFRTPLYPWLPLLFIISSLVLLANTLITAPKESGIGMILIASGLPFYYIFIHRRSSRAP